MNATKTDGTLDLACGLKFPSLLERFVEQYMQVPMNR